MSIPNAFAWLGFASVLVAVVGAGEAGQFEQPPAYSATAALGAAARGANYAVLSPVVSDGALRHYTVKSTYGEFQAVGDQLMLARIKELNALNALEKTSGAQKFGEGAVKAGLGPVVFAGNFIAHPVDTTQNTFAGAASFSTASGSA